MDPNSVRKESNKRSTLYLLLAVILVIAAVAGAAYVFIAFPDVLKDTLIVIAVIVVAVLVIGVAIALVALVVAVPYFARGREIQTDMKYDLDDVEEVDGKMLEGDRK